MGLESVATLPLASHLGIPEGFATAGWERLLLNPRLCVMVSSRRVKWETGEWADIKRVKGSDNSETLIFEPDSHKKYKAGVTVG